MSDTTDLADRINTELDRREALAQKATATQVDDDEWHEADMLQRWRSFSPGDAEFIASSSPPVVLAYLAGFRTITGRHTPRLCSEQMPVLVCKECLHPTTPCPTLLDIASALGLEAP